MKEDLVFIVLSATGNLNVLRQIEWQSLLKWLHPRTGIAVLDVACGSGTLSMKLAEAGCAVVGFDVSRTGIGYATRLAARLRMPCEFSIQNAENIALVKESFDVVVCSSALQQMKSDMDVLREIHRVLKPGGRLLLTCDSETFPSGREWRDAHSSTAKVVNYYTRETLQTSLGCVGLRLVRFKYLINSNASDFFYRFGIRQEWAGLLWIIVSLTAYPVCVVADWLLGRRDVGHSLLVEAIK